MYTSPFPDVESDAPTCLSSCRSTGFGDEPPAEVEADADDFAGRCFGCGRQSSPNRLLGINVPLCDRCLAESVVATVGLPLIRAVVMDAQPPREPMTDFVKRVIREETHREVARFTDGLIDAHVNRIVRA